MKPFSQTPQRNGIFGVSTGRLRVEGSGVRILGIMMLINEDLSDCKMNLSVAACPAVRKQEC